MNPFETLKERWQRFRAVVNSGDNAGGDLGTYRIEAERSLEALIEALKVFMDSPQPAAEDPKPEASPAGSSTETPLSAAIAHMDGMIQGYWDAKKRLNSGKVVEKAERKVIAAAHLIVHWSAKYRPKDSYQVQLDEAPKPVDPLAAELERYAEERVIREYAYRKKAEATNPEPLVKLVELMELFLKCNGYMFTMLAHLDHLGVESEGHILEIRKVKGGGK